MSTQKRHNPKQFFLAICDGLKNLATLQTEIEEISPESASRLRCSEGVEFYDSTGKILHSWQCSQSWRTTQHLTDAIGLPIFSPEPFCPYFQVCKLNIARLMGSFPGFEEVAMVEVRGPLSVVQYHPKNGMTFLESIEEQPADPVEEATA